MHRNVEGLVQMSVKMNITEFLARRNAIHTGAGFSLMEAFHWPATILQSLILPERVLRQNFCQTGMVARCACSLRPTPSQKPGTHERQLWRGQKTPSTLLQFLIKVVGLEDETLEIVARMWSSACTCAPKVDVHPKTNNSPSASLFYWQYMPCAVHLEYLARCVLAFYG